MNNQKKILIISDGKAGHFNQSVAFCKLKNIDFDVFEIDPKDKVKKILSYILDFFHLYINLNNYKIQTKNYDAVLSTGSATYYTNKYIAKKLQTKSIAIMLPSGFRYSDFDYILAQEHDNSPSLNNNIITMPLNLSINTPKGYIKKKEQKSLGIILGGDNTVFTMSVENIKIVLDEIYKNYPSHLKYITTSRRTPIVIDKLLKNYKFDYEVIYSQESTINPIPDFIEVCDELFITIDSTSMLSEAKANSDANIHIISLESKQENTKYHRLAQAVENLKGRFDYMQYLDKVLV